jgi:hypothetical protein
VKRKTCGSGSCCKGKDVVKRKVFELRSYVSLM